MDQRLRVVVGRWVVLLRTGAHSTMHCTPNAEPAKWKLVPGPSPIADRATCNVYACNVRSPSFPSRWHHQAVGCPVHPGELGLGDLLPRHEHAWQLGLPAGARERWLSRQKPKQVTRSYCEPPQ